MSDPSPDVNPSPAGPALEVLLFAEGVTLAHVARPLALGRALAARGHRVRLAVDGRHRRMTVGVPFEVVELPGIGPERFLDALARGRPVFDLPTLERYVEDDLVLIERWRPQVVLGDFRLSLAVSARRAGVPYAALGNAYWHPAFSPPRLPLPALPFTRWLPLPLAELAFRLAGPVAFARHAAPMDRLRRAAGLSSLGGDFRLAYTESDRTLFADPPELYGAEGRDAQAFIGPVAWSPPVALPHWWAELDRETRPLVYLTLGSSGSGAATMTALEALAGLPVRVALATAGRALPGPLPSNVWAAEYLPGEALARRARLVVCNGGSPGTQQALAAGTPVLGLSSNMDQFLNMAVVEQAGGGRGLRVDRLRPAALRRQIAAMLDDAALADRARAWAPVFARHDAGAACEAQLLALAAGHRTSKETA